MNGNKREECTITTNPVMGVLVTEYVNYQPEGRAVGSDIVSACIITTIEHTPYHVAMLW